MDDRSVKVFTHEFIWISFGHAVTIVAGLLSIRLYTELAPREVLGAASLVMGAMTLLMNLIVAPFTQTQVRYQAEYSRLGQGDRLPGFHFAACLGSDFDGWCANDSLPLGLACNTVGK